MKQSTRRKRLLRLKMQKWNTDEIAEADIEEAHAESDLAVQENNENDEIEPEEDMEQIKQTSES